MESWGRFDEASLPNKKDFYSSLNTVYVQSSKVIHYYLLMYLKIL